MNAIMNLLLSKYIIVEILVGGFLEGIQNYKKAYLNFKKSATYKDSVHSEEKIKSIAEMQTKYETEKKEQKNIFLSEKNEFNELIISRQKSLRNLLIIILLIIIISLIISYHQFRLKKQAYEELKKADKIIKQQNDELELLNKTRDRFFSIISHDLKNSFTSLQIGTELLLEPDKLEKDEIIMISKELKDSIKNLYKMLENLLAWAQIQLGKIHNEPAEINLARVVEDIKKIFKGKLLRKQIDLVTELDENTILFVDKNMMFSVLHNLISNAIKFTYDGGKINVLQKLENDNIIIAISDSGIGISEDRIQNIFSVDEISSTPCTRDEKGSGLGLILCKELVEKNKGKIEIKSIVDEGTTVTLTFSQKE